MKEKKRERKKFGACHINYYGVTKRTQVVSQELRSSLHHLHTQFGDACL